MSRIVIGKGPLRVTNQTPYTTLEPWVRPSDWIPIDEVLPSEEKISGLYAVFPDLNNFCALNVRGAFTVDWGDGVVENYASANIASHTYDFDSINSDITSEGFKTVKITITPQVNENITYFLLIYAEGTNNNYVANWLDMNVSLPNCTYFNLGSRVRNIFCRRVNIVALGNITDASNIFSGFNSLRELNIPENSFQNATTMSGCFSQCYEIQQLPYLNTSSVTNMRLAFSQTYNLNEIPSYDFSKVTDMSNCFDGCGVRYLPENIDFSSVITFRFCFAGSGLKEFVVEDLPSCTVLQHAFYYNRNIRRVYIKNSALVVDCLRAFMNCISLEELYLGNVPSTTNMQDICNGDRSLKKVTIKNTNSLTNITSAFAYTNELETVNLFDTSQCTSHATMFFESGIKEVPLYDTSNSTNFYRMFRSAYRLRYAPAFDLSNAESINEMFLQCYSLIKCDIKNTSNTATAVNTFYNDYNLSEVPNFSLDSATDIRNVHYNCYSIRKVEYNLQNATAIDNAFANCRSLEKVDLQNVTANISFFDCNLSGDELNRIYTSLPVVSSATITVTNNYGVNDDDPTIATSKGWTVVG